MSWSGEVRRRRGYGCLTARPRLVVHTEPRPPAAELLVESVRAAVERFVDAGGTLVSGPFEVPIGRGAVVADPWGNALVFLDMSKGALKTDSLGNVAG